MNDFTDKEIKELVNNFTSQYALTIHFIVAHYISIGSRVASKLTKTKLKNIYSKLLTEEEKAESNGKIMLISPSFQLEILQGCADLAKLPHKAVTTVIKENLL